MKPFYRARLIESARLNAQVGFESIGGWAIVLLFAVCVSCSAAAIGLWRGARSGHSVAVAMMDCESSKCTSLTYDISYYQTVPTARVVGLIR